MLNLKELFSCQQPFCLSLETQTPKPNPLRRRWSADDLSAIVSALTVHKTADIAANLGVNAKALRSLLRRHGINLRDLRHDHAAQNAKPKFGVIVRRSVMGPTATYGAEALAALLDEACRWPIGDPAEPDFQFCQADRVPGHSYCLTHERMAYEPIDSSKS